MEIEDVDEVLLIAAASPLNPWSKDMFFGEIAHPLSHCFLIRGENDRNKSSAFLRGIKPSRKIILSHSSPQKSCGVFSKALDKNTPLGFICFRNIGEESELLNICIHPGHRQKGLGKMLMDFYIDFCSQKGVKNYYLEVHPLNIPAVHLYQSFDFQPAGKRKNFYQGKYDALLMER